MPDNEPLVLHPRALHTIYKAMQCFDTETRILAAKRFLKKGHQGILADWFCGDVVSLESYYSNVEQDFLGADSTEKRKDIATSTPVTTEQIVHLLAERTQRCKGVLVEGLPDYRFSYCNREIPPLRTAGRGLPYSGRGGLDYVGYRESNGQPRTPVIGEIKLDADADPFYAFIQLLAYLSTLITTAQIERANRWELFGGPIGEQPAFDLHILLVDFEEESEKMPLMDQTRQLAEKFKATIADRPDKLVGGRVGEILCLRMEQAQFEAEKDTALSLEWRVYKKPYRDITVSMSPCIFFGQMTELPESDLAGSEEYESCGRQAY